MRQGKRVRQIVVPIHVQEMSDGSFCALDATETMLAQGEDVVAFHFNLDAAIKPAHGPNARALLVVGGPSTRAAGA